MSSLSIRRSNPQALDQTLRSTERLIEQADWLPLPVKVADVKDELGRDPVQLVHRSLEEEAKRKRATSLVVQLHRSDAGQVLFANDGRLTRRWLFTDLDGDLDVDRLLSIVGSAGGSR